MKNYKSINPISLLLYTAGLAMSLASISGTQEYLLYESKDTLMSWSGSIGLGILIYLCWEVLFNYQGKKRIAALIIAILASALSGWTLYQNALRPLLTENKTNTEHQQTLQEEKNKSATEALSGQQKSLLDQIKGLQQQNTADTTRIQELEKRIDAGNKPKANQRIVTALRQAIEKRNTSIDKKQETVNQITKSLTVKTSTVDGQPTINGSTVDDQINLPMIARAYLYDTLTALFILLAGWFKNLRKNRDLQINDITVNDQPLTVDGQPLTVNDQRPTINDQPLTVNYQRSTISDQPSTVDEDVAEALALLKKHEIQPSGNGTHTEKSLKEATELSVGKCRELKKIGYEQGILEREKAANGYAYRYATNSADKPKLRRIK